MNVRRRLKNNYELCPSKNRMLAQNQDLTLMIVEQDWACPNGEICLVKKMDIAHIEDLYYVLYMQITHTV